MLHDSKAGGSNMAAALSPLISEFENEEQAKSYAAWLKVKVQASLDDPRPSIAHDQVMAEMDAIIAQAEDRHSIQK